MAKGKLSEALEALKDAVVDLSELNVRTFVGKVEIDTETAGDPDWDQLMKAATAAGKIKLALSTTIKIDGDCDAFEDTTLATDALRGSHESAIAAGHEVRSALFDLVKDTVKGMIRTPAAPAAPPADTTT
jgi:hypothetical protein